MTSASHFVFRNGKFFQASKPTDGSKPEATFAEALVIKDGVITFVGDADAKEVTAALDGGAKQRDVQGRLVVPGFFDGHVHLAILGQSLNKLSLKHCNNLEDIRKAIREYARANPDQKRIFCREWMHSMTPEGARATMLDDLDPKGRPILITTKDLHSTWANSAALAELKLDDEPDPPGGNIERDPETGKPSGVIAEAANMKFIRPYMASIQTMDDRVKAIKAAITEYNSAGYTGLIDMAMDPDAWDALQEYRKREKAAGRTIPMRMAIYWLILPKDTDGEHIAQVEEAAELAKEFSQETDPECRVVGIKLVCDGIIDSCTASLKEPYSHNLGTTEPVWTPEMLGPVVECATKHRLQLALHAIGDRTVGNAIDALEKYADPALRPRIEHLEITTEEDARRLGKLGITASIHPVHADPAIIRAWPKLIGEHRCGRAFAYREFADGGAPLAIGSDSPSAPHQLIHNLYVATNRRSAREPELQTVINGHFALTLCETVSGMTEGAARSCFSEDQVGTLEVGKRADLVVMDMEWDPKMVLQSRVVETWFDGTQVYAASQQHI